MLDWHSCQICYPLEIKFFFFLLLLFHSKPHFSICLEWGKSIDLLVSNLKVPLILRLSVRLFCQRGKGFRFPLV